MGTKEIPILPKEVPRKATAAPPPLPPKPVTPPELPTRESPKTPTRSPRSVNKTTNDIEARMRSGSSSSSQISFVSSISSHTGEEKASPRTLKNISIVNKKGQPVTSIDIPIRRVEESPRTKQIESPKPVAAPRRKLQELQNESKIQSLRHEISILNSSMNSLNASMTQLPVSNSKPDLAVPDLDVASNQPIKVDAAPVPPTTPPQHRYKSEIHAK